MKNKIIFLSIFLTNILFANGISIDSVGLNFGKSYFPYEKTDISGNTNLTKIPEKRLKNYELYLTINNIFGIEDLKPYISMNLSHNNDLENNYFLIGLNKYFKIKNSLIYVGILTGYGELEWKFNPLNSSTNGNFKSESYLAGLHAGYEYPIKDNLFLTFGLKGIFHNYEASLKKPTTYSKIEHNSTISSSIGIKYSF